MKIIKLKGGLGNQMFQYAFAKLIEQKTKEEVLVDFSAYTSLKGDVVRVPRIVNFSISLLPAEKRDVSGICCFSHYGNSQSFFYRIGIFAEKTLNKKYFWEPHRAYINVDEILKYSFFDGYWQSYKYIEPVFEDLKKEFVPRNPLSEKTCIMQEKISKENAVFIGIRKGDYEAEVSHYGSFSENYYISAIKKIEESVENPIFYIFSNDIEWCKTNIDWGNRNVIFRNKEDQTDDFEELILMASCKHAIMVNSTYHWWGAYLINNPDKIIICPEKWFFDDKPIDIIPPQWIKWPDR